MLSRISIDVDHDNAPVVRIQYQDSEDVRDKLVKRFLESFSGGASAEFRYEHNPHSVNTVAVIRPGKLSADVGLSYDHLQSYPTNAGRVEIIVPDGMDDYKIL